MFEYLLRRVGGETGRFVESVWFARGRIAGARELIAPTGSTVAAVVLGDPIRQTPLGAGTALVAETGFLIGPHDRPIVNEPLGETFCVGMVTTPVGCRPALGLAPATLRGRVVDLLQAWPTAAGLRSELIMCQTPAEALDVVEDTLSTLEPFDSQAFARCEAAVRQLSAEPTRSVTDIARRSITLRSVQGGVTADYVYTCAPYGEGTRVSLVAGCTMTGPVRLLSPIIRSAIRRADSGQLNAFAATFTRE